ncbi:hypothetical protein KVT40_008238 [Elsinoe batatas]|uniref:F-box domain-containing protein n=1 Tax=Elsinoe batatas TaxID=2601811 RepID=A0A8K0KTK4_9PEZI|nr:hypothetical protein KVT40_008238 [Elsinoe batatas]
MQSVLTKREDKALNPHLDSFSDTKDDAKPSNTLRSNSNAQSRVIATTSDEPDEYNYISLSVHTRVSTPPRASEVSADTQETIRDATDKTDFLVPKNKAHDLELPPEITNNILELLLVEDCEEIAAPSSTNFSDTIAPEDHASWKAYRHCILQVCRNLRHAGVRMFYERNIFNFESSDAALKYCSMARELGLTMARKWRVDSWDVASGSELLEELLTVEEVEVASNVDFLGRHVSRFRLGKVDCISSDWPLTFVPTMRAWVKRMGGDKAAREEVLSKVRVHTCDDCQEPEVKLELVIEGESEADVMSDGGSEASSDDESVVHFSGVPIVWANDHSINPHDEWMAEYAGGILCPTIGEVSDEQLWKNSIEIANTSDSSGDQPVPTEDAGFFMPFSEQIQRRCQIVSIESVHTCWGRCNCYEGLQDRTRAVNAFRRQLEQDPAWYLNTVLEDY